MGGIYGRVKSIAAFCGAQPMHLHPWLRLRAIGRAIAIDSFSGLTQDARMPSDMGPDPRSYVLGLRGRERLCAAAEGATPPESLRQMDRVVLLSVSGKRGWTPWALHPPPKG